MENAVNLTIEIQLDRIRFRKSADLRTKAE